MAYERQWKLGEDLFVEDNLLDQISFYDIILAVKCNYKIIDEDAVTNTFEEILDQHLDDARYLLEKNIERIIEEAEKMRGH